MYLRLQPLYGRLIKKLSQSRRRTIDIFVRARQVLLCMCAQDKLHMKKSTHKLLQPGAYSGFCTGGGARYKIYTYIARCALTTAQSVVTFFFFFLLYLFVSFSIVVVSKVLFLLRFRNQRGEPLLPPPPPEYTPGFNSNVAFFSICSYDIETFFFNVNGQYVFCLVR